MDKYGKNLSKSQEKSIWHEVYTNLFEIDCFFIFETLEENIPWDSIWKKIWEIAYLINRLPQIDYIEFAFLTK